MVFVSFMKKTIDVFESISVEEFEELKELQSQFKYQLEPLKTLFGNMENVTSLSYAEAKIGARAAATLYSDEDLTEQRLGLNGSQHRLMFCALEWSKIVDRSMDEQNESQKKFSNTLDCFKRAVSDLENNLGMVSESHFLNVLHHLWLTQLSNFELESKCEQVMNHIDNLLISIGRLKEEKLDVLALDDVVSQTRVSPETSDKKSPNFETS